MSLHTGLSTWVVRSSSASGIQVEQLETARHSADQFERYVQRIERRTLLISVSVVGVALLICLVAVFWVPS